MQNPFERLRRFKKGISALLSLIMIFSFLPGMQWEARAEADGAPPRATDTDTPDIPPGTRTDLSRLLRSAEDFYLEMRNGANGWSLYKMDSSDAEIEEYTTGKGINWAVTDTTTLVLMNGFSFASGDMSAALKVADGAKLEIADGAMVALAATSAVGETNGIAFEGAVTLNVGTAAELVISATSDNPGGAAGTAGISAPADLTINIAEGAELEILVDSKGANPSTASGIIDRGALEIHIGDAAELEVEATADGGAACNGIVTIGGGLEIELGDAAELEVAATERTIAGAPCNGILAFGEVQIYGAGTAEILATGEDSTAMFSNGDICLSGNVEVLAEGAGTLGNTANGGTVKLEDKAVLLAKGGEVGIAAASKPTGAGAIAVDTEKNPVPPPATRRYTAVDDGVSGITFDDTGLGFSVFQLNGAPAKYVRLAAVTPADYYLEFKQDNGAWKLFRSDTNAEYAEQTSKWEISGDTLTFKSDFEFASTTSYALVLDDGGNLALADAANVLLETTTSGQQLAIWGQGDHSFTIGAGALLDVQTASSSAMMVVAIDVDGSLTVGGTGKINAVASAPSVGGGCAGISFGKTLTLNQDVIVTAQGMQYGIQGETAAANPSTLVINDSAVLTGRGQVSGVQVGQKPTTPQTIAYDAATSDPNPLPTPVAYSNVLTDTFGLTYSTVRHVFEYNNDQAKYVRLAGGGTPDYFLRFVQDNGTWKLRKYQGNAVTLIGDYTEQGGFSINQNGTLTFTDDFTFRSSEKYALVMTSGSTLKIADGKTVTLGVSGAETLPMALLAEGTVTFDIGQNGMLDVRANSSVDTTIRAIAALTMSSLTIKGSGTIHAVAEGANASSGVIGLHIDVASLAMSGSVQVETEGKNYGSAISQASSVSLADTAALVGKGECGITAFMKPTAIASIAASAQRDPNPEPALRDYGIVDNGSDLTFGADVHAFKINGGIAPYVKLSAQAVAPIITTDTLHGGMTGTAYTQTLTATGTAPITWALDSGSLPSGLSLNTATGEISGTPTAAGTFTFSIKATNAVGSDTKQFTIDVTAAPEPPVITTTNLHDSVVGASYTQTMTATGTAPITWSVSGTLPAGLSLDTATGIISGTPSSAETAVFTITATNAAGSDSKEYTITIAAAPSAPVITTTALHDGVTGTAYSQKLAARGTAPITWSISSGALPSGLSLNPVTGMISGTPTTAGTAVFTVVASNLIGSDSQQFTICITAAAVAPLITTAGLHDGKTNEYYTQTLSATGTAPITWSVASGALPDGLQLNASTGIISGTASAAGTFTFTIQAQNSVGNDTAQFTITITQAAAAPVITTEQLHGGLAGEVYSQTLQASGTAPITWAITSGSLPDGLDLNPHTGAITGTPTTAETQTVTITATNSAGADSKAFRIAITSAAVAPSITTTSLPGAIAGEAYTQALSAMGTAPITWSVSNGALPDGLSLNPVTGVISGTPTTAGMVRFAIQASNSAGNDTKQFVITIASSIHDAPRITTASLPNATKGKTYARTLTASGDAPITWQIASGTLPDGLSLNPSTGEISGTPTAVGTFHFTIQATNAYGNDTKDFALTITTNGGGGGGGGSLHPSTTTEEVGGATDGDALVIVDDQSYNAGIVTVDETNRVTMTVVDQDLMAERIENAQRYVEVIVPAKTENTAAQLVVKNIEDMEARDITFMMVTEGVTYQFHASAVDTAAIMAALGTEDSASAPITFNIRRDADAAAKAMAEAAVAYTGSTLVLPPMQFTAVASYGDRSVDVTQFLKYVTRVIELTEEEAQRITTAVVIESANSVRHVPTKVYQSGGKWYAAVNSMTNSTYALIFNEQTFADAQGKWYEENVNEMAGRKIVAGVSDSAFAGDRSITRAEFAAIVVRALGLPAQGDSSFSDVSASDWYYGAVGAAYQHGIVSGLPDGSFAPNANITRQEAMVMVRNAAKITEYNGSTGALSSFADGNSVAPWAEAAAGFNVGSGLVVGSNGMLRPTSNISRAETAAIVLRLLQKSDLVDIRK